MGNCNDYCKYLLGGKQPEYMDYCMHIRCYIGNTTNECEAYEQIHSCINCDYAEKEGHGCGTLDSIIYHCPFQNDDISYYDTTPNVTSYADKPSCTIGKWKEKREQQGG